MKTIPSSLVAEYFAKLAGGKIGEFIIEQQVAILELEEYRKSWYEWSEKPTGYKKLLRQKNLVCTVQIFCESELKT